MFKKIVFIFFVLICGTLTIQAQKIYTFEELETLKPEKKEHFKKIFDEYFAVKDPTKMKEPLLTDIVMVFEGDIDVQNKKQKQVTRDFFRMFKTKLDEEKIIAQIKSGLDFDYTLCFNQEGDLDYVLYSTTPETTNYDLNDKNKKIFSDFLERVVKGYKSGVKGLTKYKVFAKFIQHYKK